MKMKKNEKCKFKNQSAFSEKRGKERQKNRKYSWECSLALSLGYPVETVLHYGPTDMNSLFLLTFNPFHLCQRGNVGSLFPRVG